MKKTLYSLMLSDDVVREIDILAHQLGTNRSNLVNRILAEHVSLQTPEVQINSIFSTLSELIAPSRDLVSFYEPNTYTMSLKSCLEYKYRPTVRYEVELYEIANKDEIGEISVIFRTQSATLLEAMTIFFRLWKTIEDKYLSPYVSHKYALYEGKFTRSINIGKNLSSSELANAISDYIQLFDSLMKKFISGAAASDDISREYISFINKKGIII